MLWKLVKIYIKNFYPLTISFSVEIILMVYMSLMFMSKKT